MPQFAWSARDSALALKTGVLDAASRSAAAEAVAAMGLVPVVVEPQADSPDAGRTLRQAFKRQKIGATELLLYTRQMHTLLKAGVPILRALQGLQESATHAGLGALIGQLRAALDAGHELSQAMAKQRDVFDGFFVAMVRVGEQTGQLTEVFDALHHHLDFQRLMREQVASALRYPMFVVGAMGVALVVINLFVIPAFAKVFANLQADLPLMTKILLASSKFFVAHWGLMLLAGVAAVLFARSSIATPAGRLAWDRWKLKLPIAGKVLRKSALARACRSFSLVLRSGVPVLEALSLAAAVTENRWMENAILGMRTSVERGESVLAASRKAGIFTPIVLQMIMVGEESGTLDEMLDEVGGMYQRDVEYELRTMSQQIEPILIFVLGAMVLVLALGVFMPMWDLGKAALK
jgi:MSHA biogenesis protein MshG